MQFQQYRHREDKHIMRDMQMLVIEGYVQCVEYNRIKADLYWMNKKNDLPASNQGP